MTVAQAMKEVKRLNQEREKIIAREQAAAVFLLSNMENEEEVRPEYSYEETRDRLNKIEEDIIEIKHRINKFNIGKVLKNGMSIDKALVRLPQLKKQQEKLKEMAERIPRQRVDDRWANKNYIDYKVANYDIGLIGKELSRVTNEISDIQQDIDLVNLQSNLP